MIFIRILAGLCLVGIAALAFIVSFQAISDVWTTTGAGRPQDAWMVPLIVDGTLIVASLTALARWLDGERPLYPWVLVGAATAVSVASNIAHAADHLGAQALAAVVPLALLATAELFIRDLGRALARRAAQRDAHHAHPRTRVPALVPAPSAAGPDEPTAELAMVEADTPHAHLTHTQHTEAHPARSHPHTAPAAPSLTINNIVAADAHAQATDGVQPSVRDVVRALVAAHEEPEGRPVLDAAAIAAEYGLNRRSVANELRRARDAHDIPSPRTRAHQTAHRAHE